MVRKCFSSVTIFKNGVGEYGRFFADEVSKLMNENKIIQYTKTTMAKEIEPGIRVDGSEYARYSSNGEIHIYIKLHTLDYQPSKTIIHKFLESIARLFHGIRRNTEYAYEAEEMH